MLEDIETSMKIIVVGNGVVGKTSLTQRFSKNIFTSEYKKTLGVDFLMKKKYIKGIDREVEFMIWDTAGQEYYDAITKRYYKGASGALIVFSIVDKISFENVKKWKDKIQSECDDIPIFIVMNKIDLINEAMVSEKQANDLANELNLKLFKTSVKDNLMVNEVFENLAIDFFKKGLHLKDSGLENINEIGKNKISQNDIKEVGELNKNSNKNNIIQTNQNLNDKKESGFNLKIKSKIEQDKPKKKKSFC